MEDRKEHFMRPTFERPPSLVNLTILAAIFGVVAGLGGYLLGKTLLPSSNFGFFTTQPDLKINLEQPLTEAATKNQKSIAGIYRSVAKAASPINQPVFDRDDLLGEAIVVTSDGWLLSTDQAVANNQALVVVGDEVYPSKEIKEDKFTGAVFIKIEADGLLPVNFQMTDSLKVGETVFTVLDLPNTMDHAFQSGVVASNHFTLSPYLSTDSLDYYIKVNEASGSQAIAGQPYFNLKGDLLGLTYFVGNERLLIPAEYLRQAVKQMLDKTQQPVWGINYFDLDNNSGFLDRGSLVTSLASKNALAAKAGLKVGDRIAAVNNDSLSKDRSLTSILQNYRQGDKVILKIYRNTTEIDLEIKY